jgi:hypothetical protein
VLLDPRALALRGWLIDDAFFYTVVARRIHASGIPSFDGEMTTNGLQPGWMALTLLGQSALPSGDTLAPMLGPGCVHGPRRLDALVRPSCSWQTIRPGADRGHPVSDTGDQGIDAASPRSCRLLVLIDRGHASSGAHAARRLADRDRSPLRRSSRAPICSGSVVSSSGCCARAPERESPVESRPSASRPTSRPTCTSAEAWFRSAAAKLFYSAALRPTWAYLASDEWRGSSRRSSVFPLGRTGEWLAVPALLGACAYALLRRERLSPGLRLLGVGAGLHLVFMQLVYRELRPYTGYYFVVELVWISAVAAVALGDLASRRPRVSFVLAGCIALLAAIARGRRRC